MAIYEILLESDLLAIGYFRCPPGDRRWRGENWIGPEAHVVFPRRVVGIRQAGRQPMVATPNHVVIYDAAQTYRRELMSPDGDVATFIILGERLATSLAEDNALSLGGGMAGPELALDAHALLRFQLLVRDLRRASVDQLGAEEIAISVLGTILDGARVATGRTVGRVPMRGSTAAAHADLVNDTKRVLANDLAEQASLADIGRAVGASPYHLARIFRARTGHSLHAYREQIRLRHALERLTDSNPVSDLARLATDLGFASHGHLDVRFRRTFGTSPSDIRSGSRAEMRTIVEAAGALPA